MRFISLLLLSACCGLYAGLLEVATIVLRKRWFDFDHFYRMTHQFVWLIPLSNLVVFLALGCLGAFLTLIWPHGGRRLFARVLCALFPVPALLVAFPQIYSLAWLIVGIGIATQVVPILERRGARFRRLVVFGLPAAIVIVVMLAAASPLANRRAQLRENARPLPPPESPNVLLVVLDTVAAGHLSLHGYDRATCPSLVELAGQAVRFDSARATSSWTLPSHASMFTGRWVHELSAGWFTPLDPTYPTVAEVLSRRGYATAGFVANTGYCGTETGLARGFTRYEDYIFPELTALKNAALVDRNVQGLRALVYDSGDWLESAGMLAGRSEYCGHSTMIARTRRS